MMTDTAEALEKAEEGMSAAASSGEANQSTGASAEALKSDAEAAKAAEEAKAAEAAKAAEEAKAAEAAKAAEEAKAAEAAKKAEESKAAEAAKKAEEAKAAKKPPASEGKEKPKSPTKESSSSSRPGQAAKPLLQEPLSQDTPVVVSQAEVAEAVEDMRAQGASVLKQGAEAAHAARQKAEAIRKAGADIAHSSAEFFHHGTEVARANWQHGAEACQRGLHEASEAWRQSAPYLDKGILLTNVIMAMCIGGFVVIGTMLVCTPLKPEHTHHGAVVDRMFWVTQGVYLIAFSIPALVATVQCGVRRNGFENWPAWMRAEIWLGILKFQLGRAVFFIGAGFYIFPVMDNFGLMAKVETWPRVLSYFLGVVSLLSGTFLLIFDVVLSVYVRQAMYGKVEQTESAS